MGLKRHKYRFPKMKLRVNYEYVLIERKSLGAPDDFGNRDVTWITVSSNTRADITPVTMMSGQQLRLFEIGLVKLSSHHMIVEPGTDIKVRDRVTDAEDNVWNVNEVMNIQGSHKEALLVTWEDNQSA